MVKMLCSVCCPSLCEGEDEIELMIEDDRVGGNGMIFGCYFIMPLGGLCEALSPAVGNNYAECHYSSVSFWRGVVMVFVLPTPPPSQTSGAQPRLDTDGELAVDVGEYYYRFLASCICILNSHSLSGVIVGYG